VKLPDKLFEQMDRLIELELKKVELLRKLKRAYMLANVVGVHPNQIKGKLAVRVYELHEAIDVVCGLIEELIEELEKN